MFPSSLKKKFSSLTGRDKTKTKAKSEKECGTGEGLRLTVDEAAATSSSVSDAHSSAIAVSKFPAVLWMHVLEFGALADYHNLRVCNKQICLQINSYVARLLQIDKEYDRYLSLPTLLQKWVRKHSKMGISIYNRIFEWHPYTFLKHEAMKMLLNLRIHLDVGHTYGISDTDIRLPDLPTYIDWLIIADESVEKQCDAIHCLRELVKYRKAAEISQVLSSEIAVPKLLEIISQNVHAHDDDDWDENDEMRLALLRQYEATDAICSIAGSVKLALVQQLVEYGAIDALIAVIKQSTHAGTVELALQSLGLIINHALEFKIAISEVLYLCTPIRLSVIFFFDFDGVCFKRHTVIRAF